ncbi:hypothetical protein BLNAU_19828 [Blattamonas nauphoetae]|uniref:Uncharacterized protein n=1 Tax=Blattamonas nauphoetae TaxID=2049346 RepID=A0ABQ9X2U4_9EUKA|nr:hypothetical protein BLNAU_19828 [Blattamonas nauphoetae]
MATFVTQSPPPGHFSVPVRPRPVDITALDTKFMLSISQASDIFLDIVHNSSDISKLTPQKLVEYKAFLKNLNPYSRYRFMPAEVFYKLVPTPNNDCSGLLQSLYILFTSPCQELSLAAVSFFSDAVILASNQTKLEVIKSGFIPQIYLLFQPQTVPATDFLFHQPVTRLLFALIQTPQQLERNIAVRHGDAAHVHAAQTFLDGLHLPTVQYFTYLCQHRNLPLHVQIQVNLLLIIAKMIDTASFHDPTFDHLQNIPAVPTFFNLISHTESRTTIHRVLQCITSFIHQWGSNSHKIRILLESEGLDDSMDAFLLFNNGGMNSQNINRNMIIIASIMGINIPFPL